MLRGVMNKWLELLLGLVLVIAPIVLAVSYSLIGAAALTFLIGGLVVGIVLIGIMFIMLGISDMSA